MMNIDQTPNLEPFPADLKFTTDEITPVVFRHERKLKDQSHSNLLRILFGPKKSFFELKYVIDIFFIH